MDQLVVCFDGNVDALRTNYSARDGNGMDAEMICMNRALTKAARRRRGE